MLIHKACITLRELTHNDVIVVGLVGLRIVIGAGNPFGGRDVIFFAARLPLIARTAAAQEGGSQAAMAFAQFDKAI